MSGNTVEEIATLNAEIKHVQMQIETLERFLVLRTEQSQRMKVEKEEYAEKLKHLEEDLEKEQKERFYIASDLVRQHKSVKEHLLQVLNHLENEKAELSDHMSAKIDELRAQITSKEHSIQEKDEEIELQKQKIESLVQEFGVMLKQTLNTMFVQPFLFSFFLKKSSKNPKNLQLFL